MICAIIPTYNNAGTLSDVILRTKQYISDIIVVVDGSTDNTLQVLDSLASPVTILTLNENHGKGYALKQGFLKAMEMGFSHALTIDSDGQHFPEDIRGNINTITGFYPTPLAKGNPQHTNICQVYKA